MDFYLAKRPHRPLNPSMMFSAEPAMKAPCVALIAWRNLCSGTQGEGRNYYLLCRQEYDLTVYLLDSSGALEAVHFFSGSQWMEILSVGGDDGGERVRWGVGFAYLMWVRNVDDWRSIDNRKCDRQKIEGVSHYCRQPRTQYSLQQSIDRWNKKRTLHHSR